MRRELAGECLAGSCACLHACTPAWRCTSGMHAHPSSSCRHTAALPLLPNSLAPAVPSCLPISACLPCLPSDNYCFYVENYDSLDAAYDWAKETLQAHSKDKREFVYTRCGST